MTRRYYVTENSRRFASVTAHTADEAIRIACRVTGRLSENCEIERQCSSSDPDELPTTPQHDA